VYARVLQTLITDWRKQWAQGDFPFLIVQIANFKSNSLEDWPTVREAQRQALHLKSTGLAVTIDIGNPDDVHPHDKRTVGHRLALLARHIAYQEQLEYSGPAVREAALQGDAAVIWFDHATGGLHAKGGQLTGFEVAGEDGVFAPASAKIVGETLEIRSPAVKRPSYVHYGWANSPVCNLYNGEGLPASPFSVTVHPK
jgi:sialate O-acetylesterase